jgi:hypothetical protein
MCDNNVIVRNVFVYRRMNAYNNVFVYILLHTFLKWPVFPSLTKTLQIKFTSEIGFHIKYVSLIQLHVYNSYLLLFDLERSSDFHKGALDWQ